MPSLGEIADIADELAALRESADEILGHAWSVERSRALLDGPGSAFDAGLWKTVIELGWPDVAVSETSGGGGAGLRELCVLAEATGAVVAPIPLAAAAAAAWCEDVCADGVTVVLDQPAELTPSGVCGRWPVVPYGDVVTRLLVLAADRGGSVLCIVDACGAGMRRESVVPLDHSPSAHITLDGAPFEVVTRGAEATRRHEQALLLYRLATVAELIGVASSANGAAVEYAKVRTAFGRPIGTFQAIKHRLVDQRSALEVARALVNRAADACEHDHPHARALVSLAVFWAIDALRSIPEGATQVFGGIGYTWEHEAHVYLRRAATLTANLGARHTHRAVVVQWLADTHSAQR
jgi:alkylation response protein AidB-like acyl-CoA dehydrogenase